MVVDRTPWTDETVMPWGAHEGTKLADVPLTYLAELLNQPWIGSWPGLHVYLIRRRDDLDKLDVEESGSPLPEFNTYEDFLKDLRGW